MTLPSIVTPEFKTTLPSNNKQIKFRPFLVKEEKVLLMAQEGKDADEIQRAVLNILKNCVLEDIDIETLPLFDIEWLFLQLRSKSVGEVIELKIKHIEDKECNHVNDVELNVEDIKVHFDKDHKNVIEFEDGIGVTMYYPSLTLSQNINTNNPSVQDLFELIQASIHNVFDKEKVYNDFTKEELEKFLGDLNQKHLEKFLNFFNTMPRLKHTLKFNCAKCGKEVNHELNGLMDFFS